MPLSTFFDPALALLGINWGANLWSAVWQNDMIGLLCIILLLVMSIWASYNICLKWWEIGAAKRESEAFIAECLEGHKTLPEIYRAAHEYPASPLAALLREAYVEYEQEIREDAAADLPLEQRVALSKTSVESALERTIAAEMRKLENRLVNLATASALGPFIGLFGTVWGVLGAFQSLGTSGGGDLASMAPNIATALTTTVFGLFVAIPATAMYNYLTANIARLSSQMDSFAHELSNVFQKHLLRRGAQMMANSSRDNISVAS